MKVGNAVVVGEVWRKWILDGCARKVGGRKGGLLPFLKYSQMC